MHETIAATAHLAVLLAELEALRAGNRTSSGLSSLSSGQVHWPCDALFKSGSDRILDFGLLSTFLITADDMEFNSSDFAMSIWFPQAVRS
jgi:hypothetical protein